MFLSTYHIKGHILSIHPIIVMFISIFGQSQVDVLKIMILRLNATTPGMKAAFASTLHRKVEKEQRLREKLKEVYYRGQLDFLRLMISLIMNETKACFFFLFLPSNRKVCVMVDTFRKYQVCCYTDFKTCSCNTKPEDYARSCLYCLLIHSCA